MSTESMTEVVGEYTDEDAAAYRGGHYIVVARRWAHGWELHIDGVGVTQCRNLTQADRTARDYLALEFDLTEHDFDVTIEPELDEQSVAEVASARESSRRAEEQQRDAASRWREAIRRLRATGLSGSEVALALSMSKQRVSQLSREE